MSAALPALLHEHKNPTTISWQPTLVVELALRTASPPELQIEYGYTDEQWEALRHNPVFLRELAEACEMVRSEGVSFKLKARMMAESNLDKVYKMIHAPPEVVPANVKKDLITAVARWAEYDGKPAGGEIASAGNGNMLAIQINLGKDY